jgi:hypothetical protein
MGRRGLLALAAVAAGGCNLLLGIDDATREGDGPGDAGLTAAVDALPAVERRATLTVLDLELTTPMPVPVRGGQIAAEFIDLAAGDGTVLYGETEINGCLLVQYDAANPAAARVDAGPVTIGGDAVLRPVGPCTWSPAERRYVCVSHQASNQQIGVTVDFTQPNVATFRFSDSFPGGNLAGAHLQVSGFTDTRYNSPPGDPFPILAQPQPNELLVLLPTTPPPGATASTSIGAFVVRNGHGPGPAAVDFLSVASRTVTVSKPAHGAWAAFAVEVPAQGDGFALATDSVRPERLPTSAQDLTFGCAGAGGNCGSDGDGPVEAFLVRVRTTNGELTGAGPTGMPAGTVRRSLLCSQLGGSSLTIPGQAYGLLIDGVTRAETVVARIAGTPVPDGMVITGHGWVGHTTF